MKKWMINIWVFLIAIVLQAPVFAFSINIDPPSYYTMAKQGEKIEGKITVENTSKTNINIKVYAQDWKYNLKGGKDFFALGTTDYSLQKALKLYVSEMMIPAGEKKDVLFEITSPSNQKGGLYGVIFFEASPVLINKSSNVQLVGRIGTIVYHEIEGTQKYDFDILFKKYEKKANLKYFYFNLANNGNTHLDLSGSLLILDKNKDIIDRIDIRNFKALPKETRVLALISKKTYKSGSYKGLLTVRFGKNKILTKEFDLENL